MIVFSQNWFKKYNKQLCWLANSWIGDFVFKISKMGHDKKKYGKITEMHPNAITHKQRLLYNFEKHKFEQEYTTQFFSRNEYALRLQKVFYPIWLTFHGWDMLIANPFKPAWNLGFDTLTVYPDEDPESTSVDGYVYHQEIAASWATIVAGAGTTANDTISVGDYVIQYTNWDGQGSWQFIKRGIFLFDTSALTSGATISAAVMSLYGTGKTDESSTTPDINIYTSNPASNTAVVAGDYNSLGSVAQCDSVITYANWGTSGYNNFTLNSTGRGNVSKTSISKFGARNANYDVANSEPGAYLGTSGLKCYYADYGSYKPKLVVTYTALTHYSLAMETGSFTLTGKDVSLLAGRKIICETGSFILTGIDTIFTYGKRIVCETGNFVLTGNDAIFRVARKIVCETGSFVLTGVDVGFVRGYKIVCGVGRFILTGIDVLLKRGIHNRAKVSTSFTNKTKNSTSLTNKAKNSTSFTNRSK